MKLVWYLLWHLQQCTSACGHCTCTYLHSWAIIGTYKRFDKKSLHNRIQRSLYNQIADKVVFKRNLPSCTGSQLPWNEYFQPCPCLEFQMGDRGSGLCIGVYLVEFWCIRLCSGVLGVFGCIHVYI